MIVSLSRAEVWGRLVTIRKYGIPYIQGSTLCVEVPCGHQLKKLVWEDANTLAKTIDVNNQVFVSDLNSLMSSANIPRIDKLIR